MARLLADTGPGPPALVDAIVDLNVGGVRRDRLPGATCRPDKRRRRPAGFAGMRFPASMLLKNVEHLDWSRELGGWSPASAPGYTCRPPQAPILHPATTHDDRIVTFVRNGPLPRACLRPYGHSG